MNRFALFTLFCGTIAGMVVAQTMDADADGMVTLEEFMTAQPDMTADDFAALNLNEDGILDLEEIAAAVGVGTLPVES
jgi:hypothetical protein